MMTDHKPVGGRGLKAHYQTKTVRVPLPVVPVVENVIDHYRAEDEVLNFASSTLSFDQALAQARSIYKSREGRTKSAKQSMEKLLQVIYGVETQL